MKGPIDLGCPKVLCGPVLVLAPEIYLLSHWIATAKPIVTSSVSLRDNALNYKQSSPFVIFPWVN